MLAADPPTGRTLADIARYLGVAKATCYPMLVALTESGWLIRHPEHGTYQLGPALIGIGQAAAHALDVVELARPLLRELADATSMATIGFTQSGTDLVVAEICHPSSGRRSALGLRLGDRLRLLPPLGSALIAQLPPEHTIEWCEGDTSAELPLSEEKIASRRAELAVIRQRGYAVECLDRSDQVFADIVTAMRGTGLSGREGLQRQREILRHISPTHLVDELHSDQTYLPISVSAATTETGGQPGVILACVDAEHPVTGARVAEIGGLVHAAAEQLASLARGTAR